jgi:hypothetical protein
MIVVEKIKYELSMRLHHLQEVLNMHFAKVTKLLIYNSTKLEY